MMRRLALFLALCAWPASALAWEPFRSESSDVARGNELLQKGQAAAALEAYETAARKLPNDPGVQLNKGLSLLAQGKLAPAREAFRNATQGDAPAEIRGDALYNMGLAFMREADQAQKGDDLDGAQKALRESVDAFKSSLRARPGNRDAAWNLALARRRLVEVEKKQEEKKQQEEQKKDEQEKQDEQQEKDEQEKQDEQQNQGDAGTPEQPDDGQEQPKQDQGDQQKPEQDKPEDGAGEQKQDDAQEGGKDDAKEQPPKADREQDPQNKQPQPSQAEQDAAETTPEQRMPEHMRKALDALSTGEENLQKHRAQMRARQRPRRIEKDW